MTKKKTRSKTKLKIGKKVVRSAFEYEVYQKIKNLLPRGAIVEYETEKLEYTITSQYVPDFIVTFKDGTKLYIEAKGNGRQFDQNVKKKMQAVKSQHPDKDIRIAFYSDGKIGPTRKDGTFMRQSDWANKNKYEFSIRDIPEGWIK